jgi:dCTP deaminase
MITEGYSSVLRSVDDNGNRIISYGVSSYGYDAQIAPECMIIDPEIIASGMVIDPKYPSDHFFKVLEPEVDATGVSFIIPPNSFALTRTVEYFKIPDDVIVTCIGKSTYARQGCTAHVTPLEPAWEGHVTLEFSNTTPLPMRIYANEGGVQFIFNYGSLPCDTTYRDRKGKYQHQRGITLARM